MYSSTRIFFFLVLGLWWLPMSAIKEPVVNHYEVLGLPVAATSAEIKKAYRAMALKFHPDKNKAPDAPESFKKVGAAYEVLSDVSKRNKLDDDLIREGRYFSAPSVQPAAHHKPAHQGAAAQKPFTRMQKTAKTEHEMPKPKTFFWGNRMIIGLTGIALGGLGYWYLSSKEKNKVPAKPTSAQHA